MVCSRTVASRGLEGEKSMRFDLQLECCNAPWKANFTGYPWACSDHLVLCASPSQTQVEHRHCGAPDSKRGYSSPAAAAPKFKGPGL